jgi:hypothetical protein
MQAVQLKGEVQKQGNLIAFSLPSVQNKVNNGEVGVAVRTLGAVRIRQWQEGSADRVRDEGRFLQGGV